MPNFSSTTLSCYVLYKLFPMFKVHHLKKNLSLVFGATSNKNDGLTVIRTLVKEFCTLSYIANKWHIASTYSTVWIDRCGHYMTGKNLWLEWPQNTYKNSLKVCQVSPMKFTSSEKINWYLILEFCIFIQVSLNYNDCRMRVSYRMQVGRCLSWN